MASLSQAKTYGGVGSILILLAPAPSIGWLLAIAGLVLTLFAVKNISQVVRDSSIWSNMLVSIIVAIVGIFVGFFVLLGSFFRFMGLNNLVFADFGPNFNPATISTGDWVGLISWALAGIAVMWILLTVSGVFLRRGYSKIGADLNINLFKTAGLLFLIGAATTIVLVGFLILPIAIILLIVAFFSINDNVSLATPPSPIGAQTR
jgi:uncharacterized membrane protein